MNKTILFILLLVPACVFAAPFEHVRKDCSSAMVRMSDAPQMFPQWFGTTGNVRFELVREVADQLGMSHRTYQQYVDGVAVKGGILLVHSQPDQPFIQSVNGELLRVDEPSLRQPVRIRKAQLSDPEAEMVWVNAFIDGQYTARKAYKITNKAAYTISYVDVTTGDVIKEESLASSLSGTAYTVYSGWQPIEYDMVDGRNVLHDTIRNIYTYDASTVTLNAEGDDLDFETLSDFTNPDDRWAEQYLDSSTNTISERPHPALDVHWGMEKVYDYYLATFNHRGFDGNNGKVTNMVNPPTSIEVFANGGYPNNATAYGGTGLFAFGYGSESGGLSYVVAIDVMGHEFTHAVCSANGSQALPGYGEGGALNESFGDIFGNAIEKYAKDSCDWLVGAEITPSGRGLRSIKNPPTYNHPDTYLTSPYWYAVTGDPASNNDMDGVHINCGVQNYWFYLLSRGGSGTNANGDTYSITGIGMDKAIQIVFRNLLTYITAESQYPQSRDGSIRAAQDYADAGAFGITAADVQTVKDAWNAVGVYDSGEETALSDVRTAPDVRKVIRDGQVYIIRDGAMYNTMGQKVQ